MEPSPDDRDVAEALVCGIILEDVGGFDLTSYEPSIGDCTALGHFLMATVSTFPAHGVLHADIRSHNILLCLPERIVLIDFGNAILKGVDIPDEEWEEEIKEEDEMGALQYVFDKRRFRERSPFDSRPAVVFSEHQVTNNNVGRYSKEWAYRWYDEVPQTEDETEDEDNRERWRLKPEVAAWIDSRGDPPQCYTIPRPGSPASHIPKLHGLFE